MKFEDVFLAERKDILLELKQRLLDIIFPFL